MKTKFYLIILLSFLSYESYSQNFVLAKPNVEKLRKQIKVNSNNEGIYYFLLNNYKPTSELNEKEFYEWNNESICSFERTFEDNIKYYIFQCKEAGGISVTVEFPKPTQKELMNWVEKIYEIDKTENDENIWKENNTKFEPKEVNPGCYFKILEKEKSTIIELYCGC